MKSRPPEPKLSRRRFLLSTGTMLAFPTMVPASALGRENRPAPSKRITLGAVGCGGMGSSNIQAFLAQKDCQVVAACDVDKHHLQAAVNLINQHYDNRDCKAYRDYRDLRARGDIDAFRLAVPDLWPALRAIEAARTKKDIYGEKPLARTIGEQQAILKAVQANRSEERRVGKE